MFNSIKKLFAAPPVFVAPEPAPVKKPRKKRVTKPVPPTIVPSIKSDKDLATERDEPYVTILSVELDPDNIGNGSFELDWNDKFIAKLVRAGYEGKTDQDLVDRWFQTICQNIVHENFEQWEANQPNDQRPRTIDRKNLGGGFSEVS